MGQGSTALSAFELAYTVTVNIGDTGSYHHQKYLINRTKCVDRRGGLGLHNSTIGPAFWESYTAISGTQYIPGLNFYKEDAGYLQNLHGETQESLKYIPADRLHLLELGNENDYGANSGFRATNWTQEDYVEEWISRTRAIQTPEKSLRFFAPSFCCFNISTAHSFFSPWTVWNSTFQYDRDGWIEEISQHG